MFLLKKYVWLRVHYFILSNNFYVLHKKINKKKYKKSFSLMPMFIKLQSVKVGIHTLPTPEVKWYKLSWISTLSLLSRQMCQQSGARVLAFDQHRAVLVVSKPSPNQLFPGFGIVKVNMIPVALILSLYILSMYNSYTLYQRSTLLWGFNTMYSVHVALVYSIFTCSVNYREMQLHDFFSYTG